MPGDRWNGWMTIPDIQIQLAQIYTFIFAEWMQPLYFLPAARRGSC